MDATSYTSSTIQTKRDSVQRIKNIRRAALENLVENDALMSALFDIQIDLTIDEDEALERLHNVLYCAGHNHDEDEDRWFGSMNSDKIHRAMSETFAERARENGCSVEYYVLTKNRGLFNVYWEGTEYAFTEELLDSIYDDENDAISEEMKEQLCDVIDAEIGAWGVIHCAAVFEDEVERMMQVEFASNEAKENLQEIKYEIQQGSGQFEEEFDQWILACC